MKINKKLAIILSFSLGTLMFASTALAEVTSKSGYDQLKDSLKFTADNFSSKLSNYTIDLSFVVKDNNSLVSSQNELIKNDLSKFAMEHTSKSSNVWRKNDNGESYYYMDKDCSITNKNSEDIYYVTELKNSKERKIFTNPFEESRATDIEKIADALVGNLKDSVLIKQNSDGSKNLSGSLSETQIPSVVNALVSFKFKNDFGLYRSNTDNSNDDNYNSNAPKITKDIFIKEIKGSMDMNKDGLITNALFTGVLSGKDAQGSEHILTFEMLGKVSNINSTTVTKPDLSNKKVQKNVEKDYDKLSSPKSYIGTYKTDIVIQNEDKFEKIGERIVNISNIDDNHITGTYTEEYKKGYENYSNDKTNFNFDAKFNKNSHFDANFNYTSASSNSNKGHIYIMPDCSSINFDLENVSPKGNKMFDSNFKRVFD